MVYLSDVCLQSIHNMRSELDALPPVSVAPQKDAKAVAALARTALAAFEAARQMEIVKRSVMLELSIMGICNSDASASELELVRKWADKGCPDDAE